MGITSFSAFIRDNLELFTDYYELKNTKLIINGSSLCRFLMDRSKEEILNIQYGGNYIYYEQIIVKFFAVLKSNNVEPLVIFDGIEKERSDAKGEEIRRQRLRTMVKRSKTVEVELSDEDGDCWPILYRESMTSILKELEIPFITTLFKADSTIAYIANQLQCPVFSGDSNNYMYQLDGGFINWREVKYDADDESVVEVLRCRIYRRSKLVEQFGIDPKQLPLFAVIAGNNFLNRIAKVFSTIGKLNRKVDITVPGIVLTSGVRCRIAQLLSWLAKQGSVDSALSDFCGIMKDSNEGNKLVKSHEKTIRNFQLDDAMKCTLNHLNGVDCNQSHVPEDDYGIFLSEEFAVRYINESWINETILIRTLHEYEAKISIDDYTKPSSLKDLTAMISNLIALLHDDEFDDYKPVKVTDWKMSAPEVYEGCTFKLLAVRETGNMKIPTFKAIRSLTDESKMSILMSILGVPVDEFDAVYHENLQAVGKEAAPVLSLIVLLLGYMMDKDTSEQDANITHFGDAVIGSVQNHFTEVEVITAHREDILNDIRLEVVYYLNILLKLVRLYNQINRVLQSPLPLIEANKCINGVHIALMYQSLKLAPLQDQE
ncbi:Protein asteroid -like protein 1 [Halotydeus destructor]|nr:Protein asteroid -like protein 1 [Halotydeus destructor]